MPRLTDPQLQTQYKYWHDKFTQEVKFVTYLEYSYYNADRPVPQAIVANRKRAKARVRYANHKLNQLEALSQQQGHQIGSLTWWGMSGYPNQLGGMYQDD